MTWYWSRTTPENSAGWRGCGSRIGRARAEPHGTTLVNGVTFPSAKRLSPLARHYGPGRSTPFGRTCRAFQCALDLVVEPLATQRPAAVNSISNLAQLTRIKFAAEEFPISTLP